MPQVEIREGSKTKDTRIAAIAHAIHERGLLQASCTREFDKQTSV